MEQFSVLNSAALNAGLSRFDADLVIRWRRPCRPRVLVVADGSLNFNENSGFGLWRFLHGITLAAGVTNKPVITLAHRGFHVASVTIGADTYSVDDNFNFATANPAVTLANYDQIWLFGINGGAFGLSNAEVGTLSQFMNGGGGVFATGDHATLGRALSGGLPRIRHMREWTSVPMGLEPPATAVMRIDTVVNPGANGLYEFSDQSDNIPQRIYPHYKVTATASGWQATVPPILRLPGAPAIRTDATGFTLDIDVMPDHPHESECYAVAAAATLNGTYTTGGQNFEEFRPNAATPAQRVGAELVASAVSGGRSVLNGAWKPPVKPRMFGVLSSYDGRLAQAYPGKTQRPGRIVCDSTWHHYVNINLDGRGTTRNGLGSWSGGSPGLGTFTPSADLDKIYALYRNTVSWLQPANRVWCWLWWDLVAVRLHPQILEELAAMPAIQGWRDFVGLGQEAAQLIDQAEGGGAARALVADVLLGSPATAAVADALAGPEIAATQIDPEELLHGVLGGLLARVVELLPEDDPKVLQQVLESDVERHVKALYPHVPRLLQTGFEESGKRAEETVMFLKQATSRLSAG